MNTATAYQQCESITRREAKNFAYGIRLLRPPERGALSAVYALARRIDDIGDGAAPAGERLAELARVRRDLHAADAASDARTADDPVWEALRDATVRYSLPLDAFDDLIDGCERDVRGDRYTTIDELIGYCRQVAGSIGRLSLSIFGTNDPDVAVPLADDLGVALQLTNIVRDVVEDRERGRVYLPAKDVAALGCEPDLSGPPHAVAELVSLQCRRAEEWFERGLQLVPLLDRRSQACVAALAGIYHHVLRRIERDPLVVTRGRVSLPTWEKAWVAAASLAGGRP
jgi:phytoene synthase